MPLGLSVYCLVQFILAMGMTVHFLRTGAIRVELSRTFPLADGALAHRHLESGGSTGKILLIP